MNENLDLTNTLKDCPKGTKLYSPIFGEVELVAIEENFVYPIDVAATPIGSTVQEIKSFTSDGKFLGCYANEECMLFPSKDNRDWSTFKAPKPEPKFEPFQRVLVRDYKDKPWVNDFFGYLEDGTDFICSTGRWTYCIPYEGNEYLLGTTDKPKEE